MMFSELGKKGTKVKIIPDSANSSWNPRNPRTVLSVGKILLVRHCSLAPEHTQRVTIEIKDN